MKFNMEENTQKRLWGILIENELYNILDFPKNEDKREKEIKEFSSKYGIPEEFIKNKLDKMNKVMKEIKGDDYQER